MQHVNADQVWFGLLILRVSVGVTMIAHGYNHIYRGGKIKGTAGWFASLGMKPGILHAWLASITELAAGAALVVGPAHAARRGRDLRHARRRVRHQPPQGRVLRVPPAHRGLGVPDEPDRGVHRDRVRSAPGRWSLDNAINFELARLVGPGRRARHRLRRGRVAARGVLAPARARTARATEPPPPTMGSANDRAGPRRQDLSGSAGAGGRRPQPRGRARARSRCSSGRRAAESRRRCA